MTRNGQPGNGEPAPISMRPSPPMQISAIRRPASMPPGASMPPSTIVAPALVRRTPRRSAAASRHSLATSGCVSRPTLGQPAVADGSASLLITAPPARTS